MGGTRAIWHQGWKAAAISPAAPDMWAGYARQRWELFDTEEDPSECHDLAAQEPEKLQELIELWWARQASTRPCRWKTVAPSRSSPPTGRSWPRRGPDMCTTRHGRSPRVVAPNIRNRSYTIAVEADIDVDDAGGVLFAHGARFGGHALYVKDGLLKYVYNFVGDTEQIIASTEPLPTGHVIVSASFEREGDAMPAEGTLPCTWVKTRSGGAASRPSRASSPSPARD